MQLRVEKKKVTVSGGFKAETQALYLLPSMCCWAENAPSAMQAGAKLSRLRRRRKGVPSHDFCGSAMPRRKDECGEP